MRYRFTLLAVAVLAAVAVSAAWSQAMYEYGASPSMQGGAPMPKSAAMPQPIAVLLDGQPQHYPAPPRMVNGRVMVPMRGIFQSLGARVIWNGSKHLVTATRAGTEIRLVAGDRQAVVNAKRVALESPAQMVQNTVFVPLRFVSEALGAQVRWDPARQQVMIHRAALGVTKAPAITAASRDSEKVAVTLKEYSITLTPGKVNAGEVKFEVTNAGTLPHGLAIADTKAKTPTLSPGQKATLTVTLKAGPCTLYCPVDAHRDLGMKTTLTVE